MKRHLHRPKGRRALVCASGALSLLALGLTACATPPPKPTTVAAPCLLAPPSSMAALTAEGTRTLATGGCQGRFDDYLGLALSQAESSPSEDNRKRFAEFLNQSASQGLISRHAAEQAYNRYFHTTFVSLPADYNLCSTLRNKEPLFDALAVELEDKRRGMLTIAVDRTGFQEAQRQYGDLLLVFEATALACAETAR